MGPSLTSFADILFAGLSGRPCADAMTALTTEPVGGGEAEDGMYGGDGRGGVGNGYSKAPSSFLNGVPTRGMFSELEVESV
jgi:hypothetical protein